MSKKRVYDTSISRYLSLMHCILLQGIKAFYFPILWGLHLKKILTFFIVKIKSVMIDSGVIKNYSNLVVNL